MLEMRNIGLEGFSVLTSSAHLPRRATATCIASQALKPSLNASCKASSKSLLETGIFLALGLWTPVMGTLVAIAELWIAFARPDTPWIPILLATFGATLAMIGPGAWSVDAKLFGRKHIETPHD